jgi:hypothetical protein
LAILGCYSSSGLQSHASRLLLPYAARLRCGRWASLRSVLGYGQRFVYSFGLGRCLVIRTLTFQTSPFLLHTSLRALRLRMPSRHRGHHSGGRPCPPCLRPLLLSVLPMVTAFPLPTQERILLRHCGGFLPPLFSSNRHDNATRQRTSSIARWNIYRGSAGLEAFLLRSCLLSGG